MPNTREEVAAIDARLEHVRQHIAALSAQEMEHRRNGALDWEMRTSRERTRYEEEAKHLEKLRQNLLRLA
jgi:hypothetical protein